MEKLTLKSRFALLLAILIAPFAGVSAAGLIDTNAAANASAAVHSAVDATLNNGSTGASNGAANANINTDLNAGMNGGTNAGASNSNGASVNVNGMADTNTSGNVSAQANQNSVISTWTRDSADILNTVSPEMAATNVQSNTDLKAFAATSLRNDDNLSSVGFASDRVEVAYREPARFLGLIPSSVNVDVVAHEDGTVDVNYPWYSFLMTADRSSIDASIKNEVGAFMSQNHASATALAHANANSALNASSSTATTTSSDMTSAGASWSASLRAELAARIMAVLRDHVSASSTASTTAASY